ncbi:hypothetical protein HOI26_01180 [Candidatus Woesearchaeota archaeon]|nr:hypothetical protein [Candidatus Woesearchaeota archaeon]MBT5739687.1 hypothetical protein [Candidatus Woesearchaeota archaeon]
MKNYFSITCDGVGRFFKRLIGQPTFDAVIKDDFPTITKPNPDIHVPNPGETHQAIPVRTRAELEELLTTKKPVDTLFYEWSIDSIVRQMFHPGTVRLDDICLSGKDRTIEFSSSKRYSNFSMSEHLPNETNRLHELVEDMFPNEESKDEESGGVKTVNELYRVFVGLSGAHFHDSLLDVDNRLEYAKQGFRCLVDFVDVLHNVKCEHPDAVSAADVTNLISYVIRPYGVDMFETFEEKIDTNQTPEELLKRTKENLEMMALPYLKNIAMAKKWSKEKKDGKDKWKVNQFKFGEYILSLGPQNISQTTSSMPGFDYFIEAVDPVTGSMIIPKTLPPELPADQVSGSMIIQQSDLYTGAKPPPLPGTSYKKNQSIVFPSLEIDLTETVQRMPIFDMGVLNNPITQSPREIVKPVADPVRESYNEEPPTSVTGTMLFMPKFEDPNKERKE